MRKLKTSSLMVQVAEAVKRRGTATIDDIQPEFPHASRKQLHAALWNAMDARLLRVKVRSPKARQLSVWEAGATRAPIPEVLPLHPLPSVWAMGNPGPWQGQWPPLPAGRAFTPLGDWNQEGA